MNFVLKIAFFTIILFIFNIALLRAQVYQGCRKGGVIYTSNVNFFGAILWGSGVNETCPAGASAATQYAAFISNTSSPSTSCIIGFFADTGVLVNYSIYNCPIDDYVGFLAPLLAGLGFLYISKQNRRFKSSIG